MSDAANAPKRTLLGLKEPGTDGRIVVWDTEEITVGRAPENDLVLADSDASRHHTRFRRGVSGHEVEDLGTSNGTTVNKQPLTEPHLLQNKDVVGIGELQITFIQTRKDPGALGLEVVYASQLKGFGGMPGGDPGATTLGLTEQAADAFSVGSVGNFDHETKPVQPTKDLDLEFEDFIPGGKLPGSDANAAATLTLQLELEGLTPDLRATLEAFAGKVIELPKLRIRIKSE